MVVVLQNHLTTKPKELPIKPNESVFMEALLEMGVPENIVESMVIIIEIRRMIAKGIYGGMNKNVFRIVIDDHNGFIDKVELNKTVAHELKHLAVAVSRQFHLENLNFSGGFYFGRNYKWEELDCRRAEEKWGRLKYFDHLTDEVEAREAMYSLLD